jgi:hypothetical protein
MAIIRNSENGRMEPWPIQQREAELLASAEQDLSVLDLADEVTRLLAEIIQRVRIDPRSADRDAGRDRLHALWFIAISALRASRAAIHVLSVGYEDQSVGYQRLIDELHNRAQKVTADRSGDYARQWLAGRTLGKGAKLAGQAFWDFLSRPSHADTRAILDWIAIPQADDSVKIVIGPERRAGLANGVLTYIASEGRDIAGMLATEARLKIDLETLDGRIIDAQAQHLPEPKRRFLIVRNRPVRDYPTPCSPGKSSEAGWRIAISTWVPIPCSSSTTAPPS